MEEVEVIDLTELGMGKKFYEWLKQCPVRWECTDCLSMDNAYLVHVTYKFHAPKTLVGGKVVENKKEGEEQ